MVASSGKRGPIGRDPDFVKRPEIVDALEEAIEAGLTDKAACEAAGIRQDTLYRWIAFGREGKPAYTKLCDRLTLARERRPLAVMRDLHLAGKGHWVENEDGSKVYVNGDWRALEAYLKQLGGAGKANVTIRKLAAEAEEAELRVSAMRKASEEGGAVAVVAWSVLEALPEPLRSQARAYLEAQGHRFVAPASLGAGATDEDIARVCPSDSGDAE